MSVFLLAQVIDSEKMRRLFLLIMLALTLVSCTKISSSNHNTADAFRYFVQGLADGAMFGPVNAVNGLTEEQLNAVTFKDTTFHYSVPFVLSRTEPGKWIARSTDGDMTFETVLVMLPETVSILGVIKHTWNVKTSGVYNESPYSSTFKTIGDEFKFLWKYAGGQSDVLVQLCCTGAFRSDTYYSNEGSKEGLDYGIMTYNDGQSVFETSARNQ